MKPAPTDAELDISVLPENDPAAPMDQARVMANARSTLRAEVTHANHIPDQQRHLAVLFPTPVSVWTGVYEP